MATRVLVTLGGIVAVGLVACSSEPAPPVDPLTTVPQACRGVVVDAFKELIVVDESVIGGARSSNVANGPWSFRHAVEQIATGTTSDFISAWVNTFERPTTMNLYTVPQRDGRRVDNVLVCPWLKRTESNACNDDCSTCSQRTFDLAQAPFRLLAISNRVDLRETSADFGGTGEGRLIFGLVDGVGDDLAATPRRMTVIFEFHLPDSKGNAKTWAERWHHLGTHTAADESYAAELAELTESFVQRGSDPDRPFGTALSQVRTNERELDWQWDLREFHLDPSTGRLVLSPVFNTPDRSVNSSPRLVEWAQKNRDAVLKNQHTLSTALTGGFSQPLGTWALPSVDEPLRKALATQTCDGCHQTEQPSVDINFHVSPLRKGVDKLSPHLNNPSAPTDALRQRADSMRRALCGT